MTDGIEIFDRGAVRLHRDRAAKTIAGNDFLFGEVAARLSDRLADINRKFPLAADLGGHGGILRWTLGDDPAHADRIGMLIETDLSPEFAARSSGPSLAADEEALPFGRETLDLVLSNLSLHWVNDLPGALIQIRNALKPDGLFLAAMLGGDTLTELRQALMEAEIAETGGASPRVSPFADLSDAASLLQRAGFALPVADSDTITVTYPDAFALMRDLRRMGRPARFANARNMRRRVDCCSPPRNATRNCSPMRTGVFQRPFRFCTSPAGPRPRRSKNPCAPAARKRGSPMRWIRRKSRPAKKLAANPVPQSLGLKAHLPVPSP